MKLNELDPYIRYGAAVVAKKETLQMVSDFENELLAKEIEVVLNEWRIKPKTSFSAKEMVEFKWTDEEKGDPEKGIYLASHVITEDIQAKNTYKAAKNLIESLKTLKDSNENATMSIIPISGHYLSFGASGKIGRGEPKLTLKEAAFGMITTLTAKKPALQHEGVNTAFLPDIDFEKMILFRKIVERLKNQNTAPDLMIGKVHKNEKGTKDKKEFEYKPKRPNIYRGNFPNAPRSTALGSIALLGAIGELTKEADVSDLAKSVLDSLFKATMYMISYGKASTFSYNHHVIDLAKQGKLGSIVDSVHYTQLFNNPKRTYSASAKSDYAKFDLFASRFLILFNRPAFKDFLAFRAEYPQNMELLLTTYFKKVENMEKISDEIVQSAKTLGRWVNQVSYFYAKNEVKEGSPNYWENVQRVKAKALIEIESSAFSAKSGDALIAQVVTRAGRISGMDAPEAGSLFMTKTASGEIPLENAKNLIIAFSRLMNKKQKTEQPKNDADQVENADNHSDNSDV